MATNQDAEHELELYTLNAAELYPQLQTVRKNLLKKQRKSAYDSKLAVTAFLHVVTSARKLHAKEFPRSTSIASPSPSAVSISVATSLRDSFEAEAELGNLDHLLDGR